MKHSYKLKVHLTFWLTMFLRTKICSVILLPCLKPSFFFRNLESTQSDKVLLNILPNNLQQLHVRWELDMLPFVLSTPSSRCKSTGGVYAFHDVNQQRGCLPLMTSLHIGGIPFYDVSPRRGYFPFMMSAHRGGISIYDTTPWREYLAFVTTHREGYRLL